MFRNYLKTALRHLGKSRLYSVVNIIGLAAGITCTLLAVLYWKDEHSFDTFHKNNPNLYRLITDSRDKQGMRIASGGTGQVQGPAFKAAIPEIKEYARILGGDIYSDLAYNGKILKLRPLFVDSSFFNLFTFSVLKGNSATALNGINSVVITESTAKRFFNSTDAIGKMLTMEADPSFEKLNKPLIVSAVVKDPPGNSSLQFDLLFTFRFLQFSFEDDNWLNGYLGTYMVLHPQADKAHVLKKFDAIYQSRAKEQLNSDRNIYGYDPDIRYGLQPMTDVHFNYFLSTSGSNEGGVMNAGNPKYSYAFMGIGLFILLMAVVNFINITLSNSLKRSREVGVRKISGGRSGQIILQFLAESAILCVISFLLSIIFMNVLLPAFNSVTGKQLHFASIIDTNLVLSFIVTLIAVVLLTGLYPALILSRFKAREVLYNKQKLSSRNFFGRGLVILQFSLAVFLLVGAIVYYTQMNFIRTKDLGYNPSHIIRTAVYGDRDYQPVTSYIKNELAKESAVQMISFGGDGYFEDMEVNNKSFPAMNKPIDENFLPLMNIPVLLGRNLAATPADSKDAVLVNESFVRSSGLRQPLGQTILINRHYDSAYVKIAGVIKDYHFASLREPVKPMIMHMRQEQDARIWIKIDRMNQQKAMAAIERIYKTAMPNALYQYDFIDELNAKEYLQEQRWQLVVNFSSILAFLICSLGLFGLAHLSTEQRQKEIGVRKVLGANIAQVVSLLTAEFLKLVIVALIIASPLSWLAANAWLQNFAYRINVGWWVFFIAGMATIFIALVTVGVQTIKAALKNPVESLRTE